MSESSEYAAQLYEGSIETTAILLCAIRDDARADIEMYDVVVGQSYTDLGPTTVNLAAKQITDANFYLQEVARRDADEINKQMLRFTKEVRYLTWVIAFLTGVVAVLTIIPLFR